MRNLVTDECFQLHCTLQPHVLQLVHCPQGMQYMPFIEKLLELWVNLSESTTSNDRGFLC